MWHRMARCFTFYVDCKPLADIINGKSPLHDCTDLEPCMARITNRLFHLVDSNWTAPSITGDPITWVRRHNNLVADHLVNYTMDLRESWTKLIQPPGMARDIGACNFVCHSDGGTRGADCSAAAWVIEAVVQEGDCRLTFPIAMAGTFMSPAIHSFKAEAIALDQVTTALARLVHGCTDGTPQSTD